MISRGEAPGPSDAPRGASTPRRTPMRATPGAEHSSTPVVQIPSTSPQKRVTPRKGEADFQSNQNGRQQEAGPSTTPSRAVMARTLAERARLTPVTPGRRETSEQGGEAPECGKNLRARKTVNYKEIPPEPFKSGERTMTGKKDAADGPGATQKPPSSTQADPTPVIIKRKPSKDTATRTIKRKPSKDTSGTPVTKPPRGAAKGPTKKRSGTSVDSHESGLEGRELSQMPLNGSREDEREKGNAGRSELDSVPEREQARATQVDRQERSHSSDPLDVLLHPPVTFTTPIHDQPSQMSPDSTPPSALQGSVNDYESTEEDELSANIPRSPSTKGKRRSRGGISPDKSERELERQRPNHPSSQTSSSTLHPPPHIPRRPSSTNTTSAHPSSSLPHHQHLATKITPLPSRTVSQELATYYQKLTPPPPPRPNPLPNPSSARHRTQTPLCESTSRTDLPATPPTSQESLPIRAKSDLGPRAGSSLPRPLSFGYVPPLNGLHHWMDHGPPTPSSSQPYEYLTQIADLQHQFADSLTDLATLHIPVNPKRSTSGDQYQSEVITRRISDLEKELKDSKLRGERSEDRVTRLEAENERMRKELLQAQSLAINKTIKLDEISSALNRAEKELIEEKDERLAESREKGLVQTELEETKVELKNAQAMFRNAFDLKEKEKKRADVAEKERDGARGE